LVARWLRHRWGPDKGSFAVRIQHLPPFQFSRIATLTLRFPPSLFTHQFPPSPFALHTDADADPIGDGSADIDTVSVGDGFRLISLRVNGLCGKAKWGGACAPCDDVNGAEQRETTRRRADRPGARHCATRWAPRSGEAAGARGGGRAPGGVGRRLQLATGCNTDGNGPDPATFRASGPKDR
jgi:hypothetical protein